MATYKKDMTMAEMKAKPDTLRGKPGPPMIGLLVLEMIIGYEWFISGLIKVTSGIFTSGLADELAEKSAGAFGWYASFLNGVIIPNATVFGYLIEIGEILIGIVFIAGPLIWLLAFDRVPDRVREAVFLLTAAAAIGGIFMAINFHLANGFTHPWLMPQDPFDEGVDFDSLLAVVNAVFATVNILFLNRLRRDRTDMVPAASQVRQPKHA